DRGSALLSFTVTRTGDTAFGASVDYQFAPFGEFGVDGDDVGGPLTSGTLTFLPGGSQQQVALSIMGDTVYEPTEGLALELRQAQGTALENHSAATVIENDDPLGAFTASGQGSLSLHCIVPRDNIAELTQQMDELDYAVENLELQTYDIEEFWDAGYQNRESSLMGSNFIFAGGSDSDARWLEGETVFVLAGCAPPSQFPWSIDLQLQLVGHDINPDDGTLVIGPFLRASVGEASINRDNVKAVDGEFLIAITGDQQSYDELEESAIAAGYDPAMLNLLRVPDIQVPDGAGLGGLADLFAKDEFDLPQPLLVITWNIHHEGYGTSHTENLAPTSSRVFFKDTERPREPFPLEEIDPSSTDHELLVAKHSQDFDDLVSAVVAHFENEQGLVFIGDQSLTSQNAVESN
ncbi:MAG: hypothetical protein AAFX50_22215, partial [Acidobacteriota bacterium]